MYKSDQPRLDFPAAARSTQHPQNRKLGGPESHTDVKSGHGSLSQPESKNSSVVTLILAAVLNELRRVLQKHLN